VLASASPRRAYLLERAGIQFDVVRPGEVEQDISRTGEPREFAKALARAKARSVACKSDCFCLGCDTVVAIDDIILGKPTSPDDARRMLELLSGRWHSVITGVCLMHDGRGSEIVDHEESEVQFAPLQPEEINAYVASGEPFGKAGAYGIQGGASSFVTGLRGPLDNVIGLPVRLVRRMIAEIEVPDVGAVLAPPSMEKQD